MNKKKIIIIALIFLSLVLVSLISVFLVSGALSKKNFELTLTRADAMIQASNYQEAEKILKSYIGQKLSLAQNKRLLKRLYSIAVSTDKYASLFKASGAVLDRYPNDKLVLDLYLFSSTNIDIPDFSFLSKLIKKRALIDDIVRLTIFSHKGETEKLNLLDDNSPITKLLYTPSSLHYEEAYRESGFIPFAAKAAAYYMKTGAEDKAWNLAVSSRIEDQFPLLCSYMAFDRALYDDALALLDKHKLRPEDTALELFRADILYYGGWKSRSGLNLEKFIKSNTDFSWKPYYNLFVLSDEIGYDGTAILDSFRTVQKIFADDGSFVRSFHYFLQKAGKSEEASSMLDAYIKKHPEDIRTLVYFLKKTNSLLSPQQLIYKSFELLDKGGDFDSVGSYLVWLLINTADYQGLRRLCDYKEASSSAWYLSALVTLYFRTADATYEKDIIEYSEQLIDDPIGAYHAGLYYAFKAQTEKAEAFFLDAVDSEDKRLASLAWYQCAKIRLKTGDKEQAAVYIRKGLECDPDNLIIRNFASILNYASAD